mmetsp:Transcript_22409/g.71670  ORF Transcript_22409/g.71670 Transcript_22409/m.71670 type:complete len:205 (+) Transcript_22409:1778-2392(+)
MAPEPVTPTQPRRLCFSIVGSVTWPLASATGGRPLASARNSISPGEIHVTEPCCLLTGWSALEATGPADAASLQPETLTESPERNGCGSAVLMRQRPGPAAQTEAMGTFALSCGSWQAQTPRHIRQVQLSQWSSKKVESGLPASGRSASSCRWPRQRSQKMRGHLEQPSGAVKAPRHEAMPWVQMWHERFRSCGLPAALGGTGG